MHSLEIIVKRNAEAAGREAAHASNEGDFKLALAIAEAVGDDTAGGAFVRGYARGTQEG